MKSTGLLDGSDHKICINSTNTNSRGATTAGVLKRSPTLQFVDKWRVGSGDYATVYNAIGKGQEGLPYIVALKIVSYDKCEEYETDREDQEICQRAHAIGSAHQHIPTLYLSEVDSKHAWFAMESVSGGTLFDAIEEYREKGYGGIEECTAVQIAYQLSTALKFLHDRGVAHRDITSKNVLLRNKLKPNSLFKDDCADGRSVSTYRTSPKNVHAYLADFGDAMVIDPVDGDWISCENVGTYEYSPPQIDMKIPSDPRLNDVYALGALLYEMICGENIIDSTEMRVSEMIRAKFRGPLFDEDEWCYVRKEIKDLVCAMLSGDDEKRPCMSSVVSNLGRLLNATESELTADESPTTSSSKRRSSM